MLAEKAERENEMKNTLLNDFYTYQPNSNTKGKSIERYS